MCCEGYMKHHEHGCGGEHHDHGHCTGRGKNNFGYGRHFLTRKERLTDLEAYLENLRAEAQGVEEYIAELKGE